MWVWPKVTWARSEGATHTGGGDKAGCEMPPGQERWALHLGAGLGWQEAGFTSKGRRGVEEGATVREGQRRGPGRGLQGQRGHPSHTAPGPSVRSALVCPEAVYSRPSACPEPAQLLARLGGWGRRCRRQLWPAVRGFVLGEDQAGKFGISKRTGLR